MSVKYSLNDIKSSAKVVDAWWTAAVIDPIAFRLTWFFANFTSFTPNHVSIIAFIFGLVASYFYLQGDYKSLIIGAILFETAFIFDCVDGKIARLKKTGTKFGAYWDFVQDRIIQFLAFFALIWGQYQLGGDVTIIWLGIVYIFADSFHRVVSLHTSRLFVQITGKYISNTAANWDEYEAELKDFEKNNSKWRSIYKRFMWRKRMGTLPTTIEARVVVFFFGALLNQVFAALIIASVSLLLLVALRSYLTVKRLYTLSD